MDECENAKCNDAVRNLISSISGNPGLFGCDLMQILYDGDPTGGEYYLGWRDIIATKSAYILQLITTGINLASAHHTLQLGKQEAWRDVQA